MTRTVVFRPQASAEAIEVQQWYEARSLGLGRDFAAALGDAIGRLAAEPLQFPIVHDQTRRALCRRFPYAIYFRLNAEEIVVLAVHGRQDERQWQSRV